MCNCQKEKDIYEYKYVIRDTHMGFIDYDSFPFEPNYCPHCGDVMEHEPKDKDIIQT